MSEIYLSYNGQSGFYRMDNKADLTGKVFSYSDFKTASGDINPGSTDSYGIVLQASDIQDFIANYEVDSIFTDTEKK